MDLQHRNEVPAVRGSHARCPDCDVHNVCGPPHKERSKSAALAAGAHDLIDKSEVPRLSSTELNICLLLNCRRLQLMQRETLQFTVASDFASDIWSGYPCSLPQPQQPVKIITKPNLAVK
jgi:hypothetical protein